MRAVEDDEEIRCLIVSTKANVQRHSDSWASAGKGGGRRPALKNVLHAILRALIEKSMFVERTLLKMSAHPEQQAVVGTFTSNHERIRLIGVALGVLLGVDELAKCEAALDAQIERARRQVQNAWYTTFVLPIADALKTNLFDDAQAMRQVIDHLTSCGLQPVLETCELAHVSSREGEAVLQLSENVVLVVAALLPGLFARTLSSALPRPPLGPVPQSRANSSGGLDLQQLTFNPNARTGELELLMPGARLPPLRQVDENDQGFLRTPAGRSPIARESCAGEGAAAPGGEPKPPQLLLCLSEKQLKSAADLGETQAEAEGLSVRDKAGQQSWAPKMGAFSDEAWEAAMTSRPSARPGAEDELSLSSGLGTVLSALAPGDENASSAWGLPVPPESPPASPTAFSMQQVRDATSFLALSFAHKVGACPKHNDYEPDKVRARAPIATDGASGGGARLAGCARPAPTRVICARRARCDDAPAC